MHAHGGPAAPEGALGTAHPHPRRVSSFRSRRAALTDAQQEVWERLWPRLGRQARPGGQERSDPGIEPGGQERSDPGIQPGGQERSDPGIQPGGQERSDPGIEPGGQERSDPLDTGAWFGRRAPLLLEIGCGTGTSTLAMAAAEPDLDVIAIEVYRRGLAQLLSGIDRAAGEGHPVPNIRLIRGDAVDVLEHLIAPGALTGVRVFFPDPWPKARHHKRRLLQPATMALIADRLRPGGVLHAATDHAGYAEQIADVGDHEPLLRRSSPGEDLPISVDRPITKYESKARAVGNPVTEFVWVRTAGDEPGMRPG